MKNQRAVSVAAIKSDLRQIRAEKKELDREEQALEKMLNAVWTSDRKKSKRSRMSSNEIDRGIGAALSTTESKTAAEISREVGCHGNVVRSRFGDDETGVLPDGTEWLIERVGSSKRYFRKEVRIRNGAAS